MVCCHIPITTLHAPILTGTLSLDGKLNWDDVIIAGGEDELPENTPNTDAGTIVKTPENWETGYILGETDTAKNSKSVVLPS